MNNSRLTFKIFPENQKFELCRFLAEFSRQRKKFDVTPWSSGDNTEVGFIVWYHR